MTIKTTEWIWHNGRLVPWQDATVHVLSHALHYGSSVFEGLRAYSTPKGPQIFRLQAHTRRLLDSAKIHRIDIPWSASEINAACKEVVVRNGLKSAYIRPLAYRGYGGMGRLPWTGSAGKGR
jgi:branched-chain amino acid aminotransferase